jgi:predicted kinase
MLALISTYVNFRVLYYLQHTLTVDRCIFAHKFAILSFMKSLSLSKPHVLIMVGIPGSGKSFFAEKFADTFHAPQVSLSAITSVVSDETAALKIADMQFQELLKTKQSIIIDGLAHGRAQRMELTKLAHDADYDTLLVWVQTDPATAKARALKDKSQSADEYDKQTKRFAAPLASEKPVVISGKHTYATQAKVVLKKLSSPRAEISTHSTPPVRTEPSPTTSTRRNITIR